MAILCTTLQLGWPSQCRRVDGLPNPRDGAHCIGHAKLCHLQGPNLQSEIGRPQTRDSSLSVLLKDCMRIAQNGLEDERTRSDQKKAIASWKHI